MKQYHRCLAVGLGLSAAALFGFSFAGADPVLEYGPAEARSMVQSAKPVIQTPSTWISQAPESGVVEGQPPAREDQPGSPADDPGPNTDPSITAPNTVDPNGAGMTFAPEGTPGCFDSVRDYLDLWHTTGVQPEAPCFVVPS